MVFSSLYFLLYFLPFFLAIYYLCPPKWRNLVAFIGSCYFYAWGEPEFIILVITSLIIDFYVVHLMHLSEGRQKKLYRSILVLFNVGILVIAKYLNFLIDNLNNVLGIVDIDPINMSPIMLPIGISFIAFQKISYVLDCYQGKSKPLDRFFDYGLYIMFFPQLIAGPIVRFNEIASQLQDRKQNDLIDNKINGLFRFMVGLGKKVLIANVVGGLADEIFAGPTAELGSATLWLGIIAYSFQIYFDFSGYSDMAIGLALMLGFRFPENFNFPYIATSITDFWRRWHITLSRWMRDYLYIPLGGNRVSTPRLYFNLCVVFLISGLWHGAAWTFIFWGAFHGIFLILDRLFLLKWLKKMGKVPAVIITYLIVLIGWLFFRAPNFAFAFEYLIHLFRFDNGQVSIYLENFHYLILILASLFSFWGLTPNAEQWVNRLYFGTTAIGWFLLKSIFILVLGVLCLLEVYASGFNPFIYFQF
ncbi:MAG: MBOAT family protein [Saprospiraceae bacterium]|nr:MBOAT family protein [Saprospiraceae bacterium]